MDSKYETNDLAKTHNICSTRHYLPSSSVTAMLCGFRSSSSIRCARDAEDHRQRFPSEYVDEEIFLAYEGVSGIAEINPKRTRFQRLFPLASIKLPMPELYSIRQSHTTRLERAISYGGC